MSRWFTAAPPLVAPEVLQHLAARVHIVVAALVGHPHILTEERARLRMELQAVWQYVEGLRERLSRRGDGLNMAAADVVSLDAYRALHQLPVTDPLDPRQLRFWA